MSAAEQAGLQSSQAAAQEPLTAAEVSSSTADSQPRSASQTPAAGSDDSMTTSAAAVHDAATAAPQCDHGKARSATAVADAAPAVQYGSPPTLRPICTRRSSSMDVSKRGEDSMSIDSADPGYLAAGQSGLHAPGSANSMQTSPIFGVASGSSQTFTPAQNHTVHVPKQGTSALTRKVICNDT